MSKTKNTNPKKNNPTPTKRTEPRFSCTNWTPDATLNFSGPHKLARKVITTGTWHIDADDILAEAREHLRMGQQVYLGTGLLLQPMMKKDLSGIYVHARAIGEFGECLADKKAVITHRGEELDEKGVTDMRNEYLRRRHEYDVASVTPDIMVTCPKCGNRFRVGKRESED